MNNEPQHIAIRGGGITGVWQAYVLAGRGHRVTLVERNKEPFLAAASWVAGAMLAPYCETESAEPIIRKLGLRSMKLWRQVFPPLRLAGTLVVAPARDTAELKRFADRTEGHRLIGPAELARLEPDLEGRFHSALYFEEEGHLQPHWALTHMLQHAFDIGVEARFDTTEVPADADLVIDCRGISARDELGGLRAVRGEMAIIHATDVEITRPVRLLHPRFPIYLVPWPDNYYMLGATMIESDDRGPVSVRSALELLGSAYALHPGLGEAQVVKLASGLRPAFPDNVPKIVVRGRTIHVNGIFRHGFLTAPALAEMVADLLDGKIIDSEVLVVEN
jgi:glycine oxidase